MATVSFESTMTIDNEEQMKIILDAIDEAEKRGPLAKHTPEETMARTEADYKFLMEKLDQ